MTYLDHIIGHLRLTVLRALAEVPTYRANDSVLHQAAEALGLPTTRDQLRAQLAWLAEQGLIATEQVGDRLIVATATERGLDVAAGRAVVPGIERPSPRG